MNIDKIRNLIVKNIDKSVCFKLNGSRNQTEEFSGRIINAYRSVFIIRLLDTDMVRSFAYTDILIGNLEIKL